MHSRSSHLDRLRRRLADFPVVALLGPRQVGKTTLARQLAAAWDGPSALFDLEDPDHLARLADPSFALRPLRGLVVLDEIQWRSDLFPLLRVLADRPDSPARFLILGSASPELVRHASESLAGRIGFHELEGFGLDEIGAGDIDARWLRGGFPRALLATSDVASAEWRAALIRTYLERDLAQLGFALPAATLRRFWTMLAHYHGQTWNGSELARAMGVTDKTVSRWLDVLEGTFLVRRLRPWHANVGRREIKAPKVYITDTGLLHSLLGIREVNDLLGHPSTGASWEGFVVEQIAAHLPAGASMSFYRTAAGAELDVVVELGRRKLGFEVKFSSAPKVTKGFWQACEDVGLEAAYIVAPVETGWAVQDKVEVIGVMDVSQRLGRLLSA